MTDPCRTGEGHCPVKVQPVPAVSFSDTQRTELVGNLCEHLL